MQRKRVSIILDLNKIYNQDCIEGMKAIPNKSIDMILSDPPYGILDLKWDKKPDMKLLWEQYNRIIKDNGAIVLTATCKFAVDLINANRKYFRYDLVWNKTMPVGFANARRMPMCDHELILVFYKKLPVYNPQGIIKVENEKEIRRKMNRNRESTYGFSSLLKPYTQKYKNYPRSVLKFSNANNKNIHPTQKPLELFKYLIETYSNEGDVILDSYMGSGTTAVACLETDRSFIGFETDDRYYRLAADRIKNAMIKSRE